MKHFGSILEFTEQRNKELLETYKNYLDRHYLYVMPEIHKMVAESPSSRFWVSEERASIVVSAMLAGKALPRMNKNKLEMFKEIFTRFLQLKKIFPKRSVYDLVFDIVNQPAPKFYMTPRTVGEYINRIKNCRNGKFKS